MKKFFSSTVIITSFAIFSMFFGAGNVVYPLEIGKIAQDQNIFAMLGFLLSSPCLLLFGLLTMIYLNGDYKNFFNKVGVLPGLIFALFLMGIIGPFGATPRCVALSYSTMNFFYPWLSLPIFSFISCLIIFFMAYKRTKIVDLIGAVLTPVLLLSLIIIIVKGLWTAPGSFPMNGENTSSVFMFGMNQGYKIMDVLATPFFTAIVIDCLREKSKSEGNVLSLAVKSCGLAVFLLGAIYLGLSYVASYHSAQLAMVPKDELISFIALQMLGGYGAMVASAAVALACLTTAIALASVFAEFIHKDISNKRVSYSTALVVTMIITFFVSTLNFAQIDNLLAPMLTILYPGLIVLCFVNIYVKAFRSKKEVVSKS